MKIMPFVLESCFY